MALSRPNVFSFFPIVNGSVEGDLGTPILEDASSSRTPSPVLSTFSPSPSFEFAADLELDFSSMPGSAMPSDMKVEKMEAKESARETFSQLRTSEAKEQTYPELPADTRIHTHDSKQVASQTTNTNSASKSQHPLIIWLELMAQQGVIAPQKKENAYAAIEEFYRSYKNGIPYDISQGLIKLRATPSERKAGYPPATKTKKSKSVSDHPYSNTRKYHIWMKVKSIAIVAMVECLVQAIPSIPFLKGEKLALVLNLQKSATNFNAYPTSSLHQTTVATDIQKLLAAATDQPYPGQLFKRARVKAKISRSDSRLSRRQRNR